MIIEALNSASEINGVIPSEKTDPIISDTANRVITEAFKSLKAFSLLKEIDEGLIMNDSSGLAHAASSESRNHLSKPDPT